MAEIYSNNRNTTYSYAKTNEHLILRESSNSPVFYIDNIDIGKSTGFGYSNGYDFNGKFYDFIYSLNYYIRELIGRIATLYTKLDESVGSYELSTLSYTIPVKESTGYEITTKPIVNNLIPDGVNNLTVNCYNYVSYLDVVSFGTLKNFGYKYDIFYNSNPPNRVDEIKTWINFFKSVHYNLATIKRAIDDLQSKIGNSNEEANGGEINENDPVALHTLIFKNYLYEQYQITPEANVAAGTVITSGRDGILHVAESTTGLYIIIEPNSGYRVKSITYNNYTGVGTPTKEINDISNSNNKKLTIGNLHGDLDIIIETEIDI